MSSPPAFAVLSFAVSTAVFSGVPCWAQEAVDPRAREILQTALRMRAERLEGVQNYTLIQTLNGAETTLYFERVSEDIPAFRVVPPHEYQGEALEKAGLGGGFPVQDAGMPSGLPALPGVSGAALGAGTGGIQQELMQQGMQGLLNHAMTGTGGGDEDATLPIQVLEDLAGTARLQGTEIVDGAECFVLRTEGIQDPELARRMTGGADFTLGSITMWIDAEEYVPRRAVSEGEIAVQGQPQAMTFELLSQDYRRVDGMYEPFRVVMRASGMMAAFAADDPKKAEQISKDTRESMAKMEQMEEMLARMPPEQRRMAEAQMGMARERLNQLSGGSGDVEMVTEVRELRVNAGPPSPFGAGHVVAEGDVTLELPNTIVQVTPAADSPGQPEGWVIQSIGAVEGQVGGAVQLKGIGDLPVSGETSGNAGAHFRWADGKEAQFDAPEGAARVTITSRNATRIAGEFSFEGTGQIRTAGDARDGRAVIRGRFEAPLPVSPSVVPR